MLLFTHKISGWYSYHHGYKILIAAPYRLWLREALTIYNCLVVMKRCYDAYFECVSIPLIYIYIYTVDYVDCSIIDYKYKIYGSIYNVLYVILKSKYILIINV